MTSDGALLVLLILLLPLHLLSLRFRLRCRSNHRRLGAIRSMLLLASIPILLSVIFDVPNFETSRGNDGAISQLVEMKLNVSHLQSTLEENTEALNSKTLQLERNNQMIEEMEHQIQILKNALNNFKALYTCSTPCEERLNAMFEEVQLLWQESRRSSFNIHILESKAYDVEQKLETVASEVGKLENIVTEQWIQIRQLEHSLQMTKIMTSRVHNRRWLPSKCRMLEVIQQSFITCPKKFYSYKQFIKSIRHCYLPELIGFPDSKFLGGSSSKSWISRAFDQLKSIISAAKKWHYKLQEFIRQEMEMNEFTATLANEEVVFFVAIAIIAFSVMSAWLLCSPYFGQTE